MDRSNFNSIDPDKNINRISTTVRRQMDSRTSFKEKYYMSWFLLVTCCIVLGSAMGSLFYSEHVLIDEDKRVYQNMDHYASYIASLLLLAGVVFNIYFIYYRHSLWCFKDSDVHHDVYDIEDVSPFESNIYANERAIATREMLYKYNIFPDDPK